MVGAGWGGAGAVLAGLGWVEGLACGWAGLAGLEGWAGLWVAGLAALKLKLFGGVGCFGWMGLGWAGLGWVGWAAGGLKRSWLGSWLGGLGQGWGWRAGLGGWCGLGGGLGLGWASWAGWLGELGGLGGLGWQARLRGLRGWGLESRMHAVTAYNFYLSGLEGLGFGVWGLGFWV